MRDDDPAQKGHASQGVPISPEELARLFQDFSDSTCKLQESHAALEARVSELRRQLEEKDRQLERKKRLEALGLMVAGVAHEVRNPLGGMSLYLDSLSQELRGGAPSHDDCQALIRNIEDGIAHLNSVVESMLIFTTTGEERAETCDLPRLIEEALQLLHADIERTGTRVTVGAAPPGRGERATVSGAPEQIRCVLANVIKNAVQAMGRGGDLVIELRGDAPAAGETNGRSWTGVIAVRDTGPGIPAENLEKVLVPFYTDGRKKGGVGLGMAIVHLLMERHGGRVELENISSGGLEVRLHFGAREDGRVAGGDRRARYSESAAAYAGVAG